MPDTLTITPLGGLGEIGMNCMAFETRDSMVLVDCGLMFPDDYLLGIDVVIPRMDYVVERKDKLKAIVLTHGHEDHIGAMPWLLPHVEAPVMGSEFTLGLVRKKLEEHGLLERFHPQVVRGGERADLGSLSVTFIPVCHSIIQGFGLGIETPVGRIVHSGDFKIDRQPMGGHATDMEAFAAFSEPGALLLLSDSTNIDREGHALTEREIMESLKDIFAAAQGRILITLFSSHIQRMQEVFELAEMFGRKVAVDGRSIASNLEIAKKLGLVNYSDDTWCPLENLHEHKDEKVVLLLTGSQGEPLSALSRLARGEHRHLSIKKNDLVLMSSRFIPGNTKAITRVINDLYRRGAEVLYKKVQAIHASGHAHREELRTMLECVRPKFFIPVHGEYRHLFKHAALARECGVAPERALIIENGQPLTFDSSGGVRFDSEVNAEKVNVDGKGVGDVGLTVLKERQILGGEGLVIVLLLTEQSTNQILLGPNILSKGFIFEQQLSHVLDDAKEIVLDILENVPASSTKKIKERIRGSLRRYFRKVLDRDPVIVPLIMSV
ncbi:MAG: ribonuclease J [Deltaproteobacteria bacterium]|nr:ribonuclease J [Deltaproteobacteria bacterium]